MKLTPTDVERLHIDVVGLWEIVSKFRNDEQVQKSFARPNTHDSLLFACTEIAEAIDAKLRENPDYSRNHEKSLEVERELADHALMLITAHDDISFVRSSLDHIISNMVQNHGDDLYAPFGRMNLLDSLFMRSAQILRDFHAGALYAWKIGCIRQLIWICGSYPNFYTTVEHRIERLYNKHVANK